VKNTICLINGTRKLILKFYSEFERELWFDLISQKIKDYHSNVKNVMESFSNEKQMCNADWFVDAEDYFSHLYDNLLAAEESIYIAGWWVSPELYLKRPVCMIGETDNQKNKQISNLFNRNSRLIDILKLKAEEGVQVHILVYKEVKLALTMNSSHTKNSFNNLHPNVKVTRHPKNNLDLLWSHHEKIVIIDQKIGYLGGVDLCWGRYDNSDHKIYESENDRKLYFWPGIDYSNNRLKDFDCVENFTTESILRSTTHRMPWHDIHCCIEGPAVADLCRHFVERWNFARTITTFSQNKKFTIVNGIFLK
jgi:phospholipase D1/2